MGVREARKEARRRAIEEAALQLFLEEGYERCSVERIVATVGIARGTFYLYFKDKLSLFELFCERLYAPLIQVLEDTGGQLRQASSAGEQQLIFLQMSLSLAEALKQVKPYFLLHFREQRSAGPQGRVIGEWMRRIEDQTIGILVEAKERGLVRALNATAAGLAIIGAVERMLWCAVSEDRDLDQDEVTLELASLFYQGIGVQS